MVLRRDVAGRAACRLRLRLRHGGLGAAAGFFAGWMALLDYLLIPSVAYLFSGIAMHALVPAVPAWVFTVGAFAATTALNLRGVGVAARVGFVVLLIELAALAVFLLAAAVVLASDGPSRPWLSPLAGLTAVDPVDDSRRRLNRGAVVPRLRRDCVVRRGERRRGAAGRTGNLLVPGRGRPGVCRADRAGSLLSTTAPAELAARPDRQGTAFYDVTRVALGGWLATLIAVTKAVGPAFAAMTAQAAAARLLLGMARDGRLPTALAEVDRARGVPTVALVSTGALTLVVSVWAARRSDGLPLLVSIVDVGALAAFALLHASVVGYFVAARRARTADRARAGAGGRRARRPVGARRGEPGGPAHRTGVGVARRGRLSGAARPLDDR